MGPGDLTEILPELKTTDANVLRGVGDDAGVYRVSESIAIVQTADFITPIVDDPRDFGRIAAANALSDIFAMGGEAKTALALVMHDRQNVPIEALRETLAGGIEKIEECGASLIGGHSVSDLEMKFGLSVTGFVNPARFWRNTGARSGDRLILTKPLGIGIITTAAKRDQVTKIALAEAVKYMSRLNCYAARAAEAFSPSACTDITGFGLAGHALEMAEAVSFEISFESTPFLRAAKSFAAEDIIPGGSRANREYAEPFVDFARSLSEEEKWILFDAQTSGGLLIAIAPDRAEACLDAIRRAGDDRAAIIGTVRDRVEKAIVFG